MPTKLIPFTGENKNADQGMQNALSVELFNGIIDELGHLRRTPGYSTFADLGTGASMDGLWYNKKNDKAIGVSGQKVYYIEEDKTVTNITGTGIPALGTVCTFADFSDDVYIGNGVQIVKAPVDGVTTTSFITDTDAPTDATHIANVNNYLMANRGTAGRIDFADTGTPETWAGEFFTFPDAKILQFAGAGINGNRMYGFGPDVTNVFRHSAGVPFLNEDQEQVDRGSVSKYSPVWILDTWYFIDAFKNLCRINGRTPERLPSQNYRGLTAFLQNLYMEDCEAYSIYSGGYHYYICNLPTEQITIGYNIDLDIWSQWSFYDQTTAEHKQYRGRVGVYCTGWQKMLIGDSRSGLIYEMSTDPTKTKKQAVATNLALQSEAFDTSANWVVTGTGSVTADQTAAPNGEIIADLLTDADTTIDLSFLQQIVTVDTSGTHTASVYMKEGTATETQLALLKAGGTTAAARATVTWATHTVDNGSIEEIGNGWYRVQIPLSDNATGNTNIRIRIYPSGVTAGNTGTVYAWGAQLETGSTATGYIKTTTEAVTRYIDVPIFQHDNNPIRTSIKTGFIDRGNPQINKFCNRIYGRVKKSNISTADDTLQVAIRWRDKLTEGAWKQKEVNLYEIDDQNYGYTINSLGSYKMRQWEIICTSNIDFQMSPPLEDFELGYR